MNITAKKSALGLSLFLTLFYLGTSDSPAAVSASGQSVWSNRISVQNKEIRTSPTSYLNVIDSIYLFPKQNAYIAIPRKNIKPANLRLMRYMVTKEALHLTYDGQCAFFLRPGANPAKVELKSGQTVSIIPHVNLEVYFSNKSVLSAYLHYDQNPKATAFSGVKYFSYAPALRVNAAVKIMAQPNTIMLPTNRNIPKMVQQIGRADFVLGGKTYQLYVYTLDETVKPNAAKTIFIPFKDLTNGKETYSAGRYIELQLDKPWTELKDVVLDFNFAYSPLCARSSYFNCPITPKENQLQTAIRAGELKP